MLPSVNQNNEFKISYEDYPRFCGKGKFRKSCFLVSNFNKFTVNSYLGIGYSKNDTKQHTEQEFQDVLP